MEIKTTILIPDTPNFIRTVDDRVIAIKDISDKDLAQIGKEWTVALLAKAHIRRKRSTHHV